MKHPIRQSILFLAGMALMSLGIALSIRSDLGTTPISTVPLVVHVWHPAWSVGTATIAMNWAFTAVQPLLLRREYPLRHLLQIPAVFLFGAEIDLALHLVAWVAPQAWAARLGVNLFAIVVLAFGVWLCVVADVVLMPGDGLAAALGKVLGVRFAWAKIGTDTTLVACAAAFGFATLGRAPGIREGTLLAMILVGFFIRIFQRMAARAKSAPAGTQP